MNTQYDTRLMISQATASCLQGIEFTTIGEAPVRGHSGSIELFTSAVDPAET